MFNKTHFLTNVYNFKIAFTWPGFCKMGKFMLWLKF